MHTLLEAKRPGKEVTQKQPNLVPRRKQACLKAFSGGDWLHMGLGLLYFDKIQYNKYKAAWTCFISLSFAGDKLRVIDQLQKGQTEFLCIVCQLNYNQGVWF